nr:hypothetical protein [Tanacetum cinerariifolium]
MPLLSRVLNSQMMANLQQALTLGTQTDRVHVHDSDRSAEVHHLENCYDNDIFNMFTQEEQYTELLGLIPEPHKVQQNNSNVIFEVSSVEQNGRTVEQHSATVEETRAYFESLYNNLAIEVENHRVLGFAGEGGGVVVGVVGCGGVEQKTRKMGVTGGLTQSVLMGLNVLRKYKISP